MVSPSFPFPGPPPPPSPYSHPPATSSATQQNGMISPAESRRTSGDELPPVSTTRQSLPSISEALGGPDPTLPYPPHVPPPPAHTTSSYFPPPASTSVSELHRRSVTSGPPPPPEPPHSYAPTHPHSPYMNRGPAVQAPHTPTPQGDIYSRPPYPAAQPPKLPALQPIKTDASPTTSFRPPISHPPPHQSPAYETPPHSAPSQAPYPYPGYQTQGYSYPHASAGPSGPSAHYPAPGAPAPPRDYPAPTRWEGGHMDDRARPGLPVAFHGESVKRHLDDFDLEASLNEVAECSGKMLAFTQEYGIRTHGNQRAGLSPRSIPHLQTVEELMQKSRRIEDSLKRIREVVIAQNHAMEQQMKDSGRGGPGSYSDMNGYPEDKQGLGGFANGDTKKRRGRAAPPGRCHSCNRAETPEWRRGPDGARTLCNACGLHYAKLTRKMGGNKGQIGSSNLRPKSEV